MSASEAKEPSDSVDGAPGIGNRNAAQTSLDKLALRHGTDKASTHHNYTPHYEQYFAAHRNEPLSLLELGVYKGASLRAWRDYFPNATITGVDISPPVEVEGCVVFQGSQDDAEFLDHLARHTGPYDIIVDDASHLSSLTIHSFEILYPHLKPGGIYVIEDLHSSYHDWFYRGSGVHRFLEACSNPDTTIRTAMQFCKRLADEVNFDPDAEVEGHKWALFPREYWNGYHLSSVQFFYDICFITKAGQWETS